MKMNIEKEVAQLRRMSVGALRDKYVEVYGEENRSRNRDYLVRRIVWKMQANAFGGLTDRAMARAVELARDSELRRTPPPELQAAAEADPSRTVVREADPELREANADARLPVPGACLRRRFNGRDIVVLVRPRGFEWEGQIYRTLSGVAKAVTGSHWNGYHFFRLRPKEWCGLRVED